MKIQPSGPTLYRNEKPIAVCGWLKKISCLAKSAGLAIYMKYCSRENVAEEATISSAKTKAAKKRAISAAQKKKANQKSYSVVAWNMAKSGGSEMKA